MATGAVFPPLTRSSAGVRVCGGGGVGVAADPSPPLGRTRHRPPHPARQRRYHTTTRGGFTYLVASASVAGTGRPRPLSVDSDSVCRAMDDGAAGRGTAGPTTAPPPSARTHHGTGQLRGGGVNAHPAGSAATRPRVQARARNEKGHPRKRTPTYRGPLQVLLRTPRHWRPDQQLGRPAWGPAVARACQGPAPHGCPTTRRSSTRVRGQARRPRRKRRPLTSQAHVGHGTGVTQALGCSVEGPLRALCAVCSQRSTRGAGATPRTHAHPHTHRKRLHGHMLLGPHLLNLWGPSLADALRCRLVTLVLQPRRELVLF
jgi:hypothetical protein